MERALCYRAGIFVILGGLPGSYSGRASPPELYVLKYSCAKGIETLDAGRVADIDHL